MEEDESQSESETTSHDTLEGSSTLSANIAINDGNSGCSISPIQAVTQYSAGDYVVVAFEGKKSYVHYIGLLLEQYMQSTDSDDDADNGTATAGIDWRVKFLTRESPNSFTFVYPVVDETVVVNEGSFCEKLHPPPGTGTARNKSHLTFNADLTAYKIR
jgi:hypothetical protein